MSEIREPARKSSIEKKQRIIAKGFELMCERGYFRTTTVDIAKHAGVSTGIIYQYFRDKKDIFAQGVRWFYDEATRPILDALDGMELSTENLSEAVGRVVDVFAENHQMSASAHREMDALQSLDEEIEAIFVEKELAVTEGVALRLEAAGFAPENLREKVHLVYGLIDRYAHEVVYHQHEQYDYSVMRESVVGAVVGILLN